MYFRNHTVDYSASFASSGFAAGVDSRLVLQVRLRCSEGSVRWVYPGQALRVVLEPNLFSARRSTVCIKPSPSLHGASVYIERDGELELLVTDGCKKKQVSCFRARGPHRPVIYLQASPQSDAHWSRRAVGFRYELLGNRSAAPNAAPSGLQSEFMKITSKNDQSTALVLINCLDQTLHSNILYYTQIPVELENSHALWDVKYVKM